ncbi:MAG: DUF418 domain-containing protein [Acidobacteriota bacterium]
MRTFELSRGSSAAPSPRGDRLLKYFAPVGRMALTNYVGQSVICTLIAAASSHTHKRKRLP